jgi:hypothetical protein
MRIGPLQGLSLHRTVRKQEVSCRTSMRLVRFELVVLELIRSRAVLAMGRNLSGTSYHKTPNICQNNALLNGQYLPYCQ